MALLPRTVSAQEQVFEAEPTREVSAFKYYFLLIAALVMLVALLLWYLHRRTKKRRELWQQDAEQPMVRDVQGWTNPRRFMYGIYEASTSFLGRRSEGLDQNGEAPPPYQPKSSAPTIDVVIPLPTLSRNPSQRSHPPQYFDNTEEDTNTTERQEAIRPEGP
jgi:hypothetical protein